MFGKIIPMNMLAQMPLPFVHRLRDIRIKQLEAANKQQEEQMQRMQQNRKMGSKMGARNINPYAGIDPAMFNGTPYDDLIDELT